MNKENLYQHFRSEECHFVERIADLAIRVQDTYVIEKTEFLDPRQIQIVRSVIGQHDLQLFVSSDTIPSEYARVIIAPSYYEFDFSDFGICLIEIRYNAKFAQLTHSQILGSLLNQLGIKRHLLGDILISDGRAQLFVDDSMSDYLIRHTEKIARVGVSLKQIPLTEVISVKVESNKYNVLSSSLRLDKLISEVLNISRAKAISLIESQKVKLNFAVIEKPAELLEIGDMVSIRGFGRFKIVDHQGMTKNNKHKLVIERMIHK